MKDTVEKFLKDEDFNLLPFLMLQNHLMRIDSDHIKTDILTYKDMTFWVEDNQLHIRKKLSYFVKDLQDILSMPMGFKSIQFFDSL